MITVSLAVNSLRPDSEWVMHNDDVENIIWQTPKVAALTMDQVKAEMVKLEKARTVKEQDDLKSTAAAIAHAKSLGFTDEMIAVMYPGLMEGPPSE